MTRTKAPDAWIVPHIRGKPVTWLTSLPPNRGPTDADERHAETLQTEARRFLPKRGTDRAVRQNIVGRGREPTEQTINPIRAVFRCRRYYHGVIGYRADHRIRGPNLSTLVQTNARGREGPTAGLYFAGPRCRDDIRAADIETEVITCRIRSPGRKGDAAGQRGTQ